MPITVPSLDDRRYAQWLSEALARIPVHTPEWTNFNKSDPGITIIEVFAFLADNLAYRSNLIPERNRLKFLKLLGIPLNPGQTARGFVTINNERGEARVITLNDDLEVRAGPVPFRTEKTLDVLPIETRLFYKHPLRMPNDQVAAYYRDLYASYMGAQPLNAAEPLLYETRSFPSYAAGGLDMSLPIDQSIWVALLLRAGDKPVSGSIDDLKDAVRRVIAGRVLSLGMLPSDPNETGRNLDPLGREEAAPGTLLKFQLPDLSQGDQLPTTLSERLPRYAALPTFASDNMLARPSIVEVRLPKAELLRLWRNLDPLEMGVGDFPPSLEDTVLNDRLITWIRISAPAGVQARFLWVGGNATFVQQRVHATNELLASGTGEPDQVATLSRTPVIADSVVLTVTVNDKPEPWEPINDLYAADPEVPVSNPRLPPGVSVDTTVMGVDTSSAPMSSSSKVYMLDPESGQIRFGDGVHGCRPPFGSIIRADYDWGIGTAGNVSAGSITSAPALPTGMAVTNPIPTWGGTEPENARDGEKQVTRYLQHRDRAVTALDYEWIVANTPGIELGRVEVLPAFNPDLVPNEPGDAAGAVTLMVIPSRDQQRPNAPLPDRQFLDAICDHLNPRRLVTTEVFLRAPNYRNIWVSIGITVAPRAGMAQAAEGVKQALHQFLSPLPHPGIESHLELPTLFIPQTGDVYKGWPLNKSVMRLEIAAVASRAPGVMMVNDVILINDAGVRLDEVSMTGLDLPVLAGLAVGVGSAPADIPGLGDSVSAPASPTYVPVPVLPEECT